MNVIEPGLTFDQRAAARDAERAAAWYCNTTIVCDRCGQAVRLESADIDAPCPSTVYGIRAHIDGDGDLYFICANCTYARWYYAPRAGLRIDWPGVIPVALAVTWVVALIVAIVIHATH